MTHGSRNLEWGIIHIVEIGRGCEQPVAAMGELAPDETIAALGRKLFGARGAHSVDGEYRFPEPENLTLLSGHRPSIQRIGFEYLFALLPYFLNYRMCFGELEDAQVEEIEKTAFQAYYTEVASISQSEEEWQREYGNPLMRRLHEVEKAVRKRLFRTKAVERVISIEPLEDAILQALNGALPRKDVVFVEVYVRSFSVQFFESAHECFRRLGTIGWVFGFNDES